MLKKVYKIIILIIIGIFSNFFLVGINSAQAGDCGIWGLCSEENSVPCSDGSCGLQKGMDEVKKNLSDEIEKEATASEYVQRIVKYLLTFVTLISVIYIIYAGFRILTSSGEDEVIKNSKKTIIYVIIGIILIWFAYEIAYWATSVGTEVKKIN